MSSARIQTSLRRAGYEVHLARAVPEATQSTLEGIQSTLAPRWILLNLGSRSLKGLELIEDCRGLLGATKIIGFCGHLEIEIRRAAKAKGIDHLLTNEQVFGDLPTLLASME